MRGPRLGNGRCVNDKAWSPASPLLCQFAGQSPSDAADELFELKTLHYGHTTYPDAAAVSRRGPFNRQATCPSSRKGLATRCPILRHAGRGHRPNCSSLGCLWTWAKSGRGALVRGIAAHGGAAHWSCLLWLTEALVSDQSARATRREQYDRLAPTETLDHVVSEIHHSPPARPSR